MAPAFYFLPPIWDAIIKNYVAITVLLKCLKLPFIHHSSKDYQIIKIKEEYLLSVRRKKKIELTTFRQRNMDI